jgi:hypothetical protein
LTNYNQRDSSITAARTIKQCIDEQTPHTLVLTGSYSIDALTGGDVAHNDIDTNIFFYAEDDGVVDDIAGLLGSNLPINKILKQTTDRLEYEIITDSGLEIAEFQFISYDAHIAKKGLEKFILSGKNEIGHNIEVPVTEASLIDSQGKPEAFRVKTLDYAIATWAIRISGIINVQKRPVRQTDIDHFVFLYSQPHSTDMLYKTMLNHPQMTATDPGYVLEEALRRINSEETKL